MDCKYGFANIISAENPAGLVDHIKWRYFYWHFDFMKEIGFYEMSHVNGVVRVILTTLMVSLNMV